MNKVEIKTEPKLKFPEFCAENKWEVKNLGDLAKRITKRNQDGSIKRVLTNSAIGGVVDQSDYFDKEVANRNNLENYFIIDAGDYVYNPRISATAPVGPISKNKVGKGVMSPLYTVFRFKNKENDFYEQYFKTSFWHQYIKSISNTGARHDRINISSDNFMKMPLPYSSTEERQKIAACLISIDDLISAEDKKLEALKMHKKGLIQKIFPIAGKSFPEWRFPEFKHSGGWETSSLGLLAEKNTKKNNGNNIKRVLTNSAVNGIVEQNEFFERTIVSQNNLINYLIVDDGDYVYNPRISVTAPVGPISKNKIGLGIISPLYTVFRFKVPQNDFFEQYFKTNIWHEYIKNTSNTGARHDRVSISIDNFMSMPLVFPADQREQQKIAECLSSIDKLITEQSNKIEALAIYKKGLMHGLFPSIEAVTE